MRIDKLLGELGYGTRSELKKAFRAGVVTVNGSVVSDSSLHISPDTDIITYRGTTIQYHAFEYFMLHKPKGYVCARTDTRYPTVMELVTGATRNDLSPVGRLDQDTEGLLLITNDGQLAHRLLSPKKHVDKTYLAHVTGLLTDADVTAFSQGIDIGDDKLTLPARLTIEQTDFKTNTSIAQVTIHEGRFHQVKRMFLALGKEVTDLKRLSFGPLSLDASLPLGACRSLTHEELLSLMQ